ncbi:UDP-D-xylose:L-fucose alpha-1,3-D-xylosyltransferase MGP4-like [Acanthaster planci]|uniref:UDP-D-xylose:L-fucose alpha-1,3-D-xylosyltransferase MGP4-like n=1 Tax=Acanthaster planci TaxID=133434 RepID=A0A8B7ZUU0_ACAPL|nr:UDP-D-xylose:L-fucose alpha-1,3-D-xylosyltransferase MGP4-like [Acanthaster planci]XP_022109328.1 UDP-D-xylose:L-fucose alpha-1,3-D-xylosyltransferase MGP4-like [Acanthaster planci]
MAQEHVYKILFFLQSAAFIAFVINYSQKSDVILAPIKQSAPASRVPHTCNCLETKIRTAFDAGAVCKDVLEKRGRISNCTLADINKRPGVVLLTTTNLAFLDVTLNMLESIKRTGVCVNTTVIAEDKKVFEQLYKRTEGDPALTVLLTNSGEMDVIEHPRSHRSQYYGLMNKRQAYILGLLTEGYEVLFSDADTFWFRDPFPFFDGDFDISLIDSVNPFGVRSGRSNFCAGFVYFKPTNVTLQFVKAWVDQLENNKKRGNYSPDQNVMNALLKNDKPVYVKIKPLDTNIFPYGPKFYDLLARKANYSTVVMHAASIRGHEAKVTKFKSSNMWLVNKTTNEMLAESK